MNQVEKLQSELEDQGDPVRVGVVICDCGKKISGVLDTQTLRLQTQTLPEVAYVTREAYPCSKDGQERLKKAIADHNLNRVLIAGCSPRLMRNVFRQVGQESGLARSFVNMANIREQCANVHTDDVEAGMQKAYELIEMGVARLACTSATPTRIAQVVKAALIIGSNLSGMTVALSLAERGIPVTIVEGGKFFGANIPDNPALHSREQAMEVAQSVLTHPQITTLFGAHITEVTGHPGDYRVLVEQQGKYVTVTCNVGTIIVTNSAKPKSLGEDHWFDRSRVKTQAEFEITLDHASQTNTPIGLKDLILILCAEETQREKCSRVCCNIGIRQAIRAKQLDPDANITILFRDLYLGGIGEGYEKDLVEARKMGITFFRYRKDRPPVIGNTTVSLLDPLAGEPLRLPYDQVIMSMPLEPQEKTAQLAALLALPVDEDGFLAEPRVRLRPGRYVEPGIYVLGSAQQPADSDEALFQAYLTASRVARFLSRDTLKIETPAATIDASLCTGCGNCPQVCPVSAIQLENRDGVLSLSEVDQLRCIGCGNCVVVCPVKAIHLPGWDDVEIPVQVSAALQARGLKSGVSKIIALACEWSAYGSADAAGARKLPYPANVRIIRTNCSARFDPYHILWAFLCGADGVYLGVCHPGECHYGSGNLYARERVEVLKTKLAQRGVDPRRLHLEFLSVDDGKKFVTSITDFVQEINEIDD